MSGIIGEPEDEPVCVACCVCGDPTERTCQRRDNAFDMSTGCRAPVCSKRCEKRHEGRAHWEEIEADRGDYMRDQQRDDALCDRLSGKGRE